MELALIQCLAHCLQRLEKNGTADEARIEEMRRLSQMQMEKIKQAAEQGKQPGSSTQSWQDTIHDVQGPGTK
jgi:hypothetical protein